jgi:hypothetical protein
MMTWYFSVQGGHTHVSVFMNGGKCGDLCFRNEEFQSVFNKAGSLIVFVKE